MRLASGSFMLASLLALTGLVGCDTESSVGPEPDADLPDAGPVDAAGPEVFGSSTTCASLVRADRDHVYWVEEGNGDFPVLYRTADDAFVPEVALPSALGVVDYAVDGEFIYWITPERLARTRLDGGHSDFAALVSGRTYERLVVVGETIFVSYRESGGEQLAAIPAWSGEPMVLSDIRPSLLVANGATAFVGFVETFDRVPVLDAYSGTTLARRSFGVRPGEVLGVTTAGGRTYTLDIEGMLRDADHSGFEMAAPSSVYSSASALLPFGDHLAVLYRGQLAVVDVAAASAELVADGADDLVATAHHLYWTNGCPPGDNSTQLTRLTLP